MAQPVKQGPSAARIVLAGLAGVFAGVLATILIVLLTSFIHTFVLLVPLFFIISPIVGYVLGGKYGGLLAIICSVVLAIIFFLYFLACFGCGPQYPSTSCVAVSGYFCGVPSINTTGTLSFAFGQSTGATEYNVGFACASASNSAGYPYVTTGTSAFYYPEANGSVSANPDISGNLSMISGQQITITQLPCYTSTGMLLQSSAPLPVGTSFSGTLWITYTPTSNRTGWLTTKIATINVRVV